VGIKPQKQIERRRKGKKVQKGTLMARCSRAIAVQLAKNFNEVRALQEKYRNKTNEQKRKLAGVIKEYIHEDETHDHSNFAKWLNGKRWGILNLQYLVCWFLDVVLEADALLDVLEKVIENSPQEATKIFLKHVL